MEFASNPDLETFRADWPGNPAERGRFVAYADPIPLGLGHVLRHVARPNPQRAAKRADGYRPASVREDLRQPGDWVCWLGHASFLIQLDGVRYLVDPVFGRLGLLRRRVAVPYALRELGPIDYVLLSHDHRDHCDEATLRALGQTHDFTVLTSLGMRAVVARWLDAGRHPIVEAGWYQHYPAGAGQPRVSFMPTQHWCRRYLRDDNRRLWGSFVLQGSARGVCFGGDSGYSPHFTEVARYFPGLDLALVGIGAYRPAGLMRPSHTSPAEAWQGFVDTGARRLMPMHYGTYDLSWEPPSEPLDLLRQAAREAGRPDDLVVGYVGEVVRL